MSSGRWTFLSHHAHVLLCLARDPDVRLREVATEVGITERAVQAIVNDLVEEGYVQRVRVGRRNHYEIDRSSPLRHPMQRDLDIDALLGMVSSRPRDAADPVGAREGRGA